MAATKQSKRTLPKSAATSILGPDRSRQLWTSVDEVKMFGMLVSQLSINELRLAVLFLQRQIQGIDTWRKAEDDARKVYPRLQVDLQDAIIGKTLSPTNPFHAGDWVELLYDLRIQEQDGCYLRHAKGSILQVTSIHEDGDGLMFGSCGIDYHNVKPARPKRKHGKT